MVNRRVTGKIGLFDPIFSLYYEDTDLCQRAREAGFRVVYVPTAIVHHTLSYTTNKLFDTYGKLKHIEKGRVCFVLKNYGNKMLLEWLVLEVWMLASVMIRPFRRQSGRQLRALFEAYIWNIRLLRMIVRRRIASPRTISSDIAGFPEI